MYLPALDLEKRIAATDNRTSFVGSDFFYEDVSGRHPDKDTHVLIKQEDNRFFFKSTPKVPAQVEFAYYKMQIDSHSYLPMVVEYYDHSDQLYRRVEVTEVVEVQGHPTVIKSQVSNVQTGGHTLLEFRRPVYDLGLGDEVFTIRSLRNPPREWLKAAP